MKRLIILGIVILSVILLVPVSCNKTPVSESSPTPTLPPPLTQTPPLGALPGTPGAANDDIVFPPGGFTYRANVHAQGQPSGWPPVAQTEVTLRRLIQTADITYRSYIETRAGETRNNIFYLEVGGYPGLDPLKVDYKAVNLPEGISVVRGEEMYGGIGGQNRKASRVVMQIYIAEGVVSSEYTFAFQVVIDGINFGSIPCTVKVLE